MCERTILGHVHDNPLCKFRQQGGILLAQDRGGRRRATFHVVPRRLFWAADERTGSPRVGVSNADYHSNVGIGVVEDDVIEMVEGG